MPNNSVILIPHYNANDDLIKSLQSVDANESIDILIVDDGSKIKPDIKKLEQAYLAKGKVILKILEKNMGIEGALNTGLEFIFTAGYKYIARLDAGDLACKDRFAKQEEFLSKNLDYALVGSWVDFVDCEGTLLFTLKHPSDNDEIKTKAIYRYNPFVHPATMFTAEAAKQVGLYPYEYKALEDWAFFLKISKHFKVSNLEEVSTIYEVNPNSISSKKRFKQSFSKVKLLLNNPKVNIHWVIGFTKSLILLLLPRGILTHIKSFIKK